MIFSVVLCNLFQSVGLLACHESWRRIFVYTSSQNTKSELRVFLKRVVSLKFTLRSRINGGGVLLSRGLEICVKYNKREAGISGGGRKMVNRVPFRLV